jgi:hypothetical protein
MRILLARRLAPVLIAIALHVPLTVEATFGTAPGADSTRAPAADSALAALAHPMNPHAHGGAMMPGGSGPSAGTPFKIVVPHGGPKVKSVTLGIRHRVFHDFAESDEARMHEPFAIGDTPYSAVVTDFLPDFVVDVSARRITSRSNELKNPAVRIVVRENGVIKDTTWAFRNMPPHFAMKSLLAFKILRIDFTDRPPLLPDTTATGNSKP